MMRAAVIAGPGRFEIQQVPIPEPRPNQIRVRLEGCGVCGSNLPPFEGRDWFRYPLAPGTPGHEGWGVVDAVGAEVTELSPGARVALLSSSAYAEYDVADASAAVPLGPELAGKPFPGEALGCAFNVFRRSDIRTGQTVAIVGIGFMGAMVTWLAARAGARVISISRRSFALEVARACGAWRTLPLDEPAKVIAEVNKLTEGALCDRVIEAVGAQGPLDLAGELTRERGRLVIAGYHQDGPRQVNLQLWNWRGLDVINAHERDPNVNLEGVRMAVGAVARGELDPSHLYTHAFGLDRISSAFEALRDRPDGFLKALVTP
jgi:threonine dehydrogenase-like Zn-dependent dehydrogenase